MESGKVLGERVLVSKVEEPIKGGYQSVEVQDSFVYKGKVEQIGSTEMLPSKILEIGHLKLGSIVLFAKYSPDTHEIELNGQKMKIVETKDILWVYENN